MDQMEEKWCSMKSINYSNYECSNYGRIRNRTNGNILKGALIASGYKINRLKNDYNKQINERTHRIIAKIFLGSPKIGQTVDHINRIRSDNKVTNLRWATKSEQRLNSSKPRKKKGREIYQYDLDGNLIKKWNKLSDIMCDLKCQNRGIIDVCKGRKESYKDSKWAYADEVDVDPSEEWRIIPKETITSLYASSKGRIKNSKRIIHGGLQTGYRRIHIKYKGKETYTSVGIHRLITAAFHGNNDMMVNHIDGIKDNNNVENLEYCTASENTNHAYSTGLIKKKFKKVNQLSLNGDYIRTFNSADEVAKTLGCCVTNIRSVCGGFTKTSNGYKWEYVTEETEDKNTLLPINNKNTLLPTNNKNTSLPTNNKVFLLPTNNKNTLSPSNNKNTLLPTNDKNTLSPINNKNTLLPTNNKNTLLPTNDKITLLPTNNKISMSNSESLILETCAKRWKSLDDKIKECEMLNKFDSSKSTSRKVDQFSMKGVYIKTFASAKDAAFEVSCDSSNISRACSGQSSNCKNYKWSYSEIRISDRDKLTSHLKVPLANSQTRKVKQFALNGDYIKTFNSMKEAALEIHSKDNTLKIAGIIGGIGEACRKNIATSYNYRWEYEAITKKDKINDKEVKQCKRQIDQYSLDGVFIRRFKSIKEAAEEVKIGQNCIQEACAGKTTQSADFIWKYVEIKDYIQ
jgi:hypothetical protein